MGLIAGSWVQERLPSEVAEQSPDLHIVATLDGVLRYVSAESAALFGWAPADLVGRHQGSVVHRDDVAQMALERLTDSPGSITTVLRVRCADGRYRWVEALSRRVDLAGEAAVLTAIRDIGDRRETELDLQRQASTDPLTGVANRAVFMDRLQQALRRLDRHEGLVAVLYLDLDRFKQINDSVGHLVGDAVLLQMAERLRTILRPQDTLARLGGDEFAVVVEDMALSEEAVTLGERITEAGRVPFVVNGEQFICTTSVGIAVTPHGQRSAEGLLQEADLALYRAKDVGRDRAEVFDEHLRTRAIGRLGTERMLRRAIDEDRLRVHYQPIIDVRTGATVAAEALVRVWDGDDDRLISAEVFIEVAEDTGLLAGMDDWVLRQVIVQAGVWARMFGPRGISDIAVNLTSRHLADPVFAGSLIDQLLTAGLATDVLQIEVTERVLMEASNSAMSGLKALRDAGVKVGLDDFGTGYSSLGYLRQFPVDILKIDRSFVQALTRDDEVPGLIRAVLDLCRTLDLDAVAEGIEQPHQLDQLVSERCRLGQGFLFDRPLTFEAAAALVDERDVAGVRPTEAR